MSNVAVIGAQWGDEGKGKIIDWLANRAEMVVRFQGGNNAGHTIVVGDKTYKLSLLPSGVIQGKRSIIVEAVDDNILLAIAEALGNIGADAKAAIPALRNVKSEPLWPPFKDEAERSIRRIEGKWVAIH